MNIVAWGIIFFLLVYGFYDLIRFIERNNSIHNAYEKLNGFSEQRQSKEERLIMDQGNRENVDFLTKIDILLTQSGAKKTIPFITTEIYLAFNLLLAVIGFVAILLLTGLVLFAVGGSALLVVGTYIFLSMMANKNAQIIEEDMGVFLDMLDAYSKSSDDIVDIMGKTYPSLSEPLMGYVEEFYYEAINVGEETAFRHLEYKIPNTKLKEILGNLQLCSRNLTDYGTIVTDSQEQLRVYLEGKRERTDARINGGMELLTFAIIAGIIFVMIGNFAETNVWEMLLGTFVGQLIILYFVVLIIIGLITTFSYDKV